ncbi:MAG: phosphoribosyltransferase family protein [Candidatus Acetothermia bacterium]|jgi:xanthine phosphoribosyltransferase|nr:phosphoribosyltransferase family protein [Candidatus Acetothermia bacterium]
MERSQGFCSARGGPGGAAADAAVLREWVRTKGQVVSPDFLRVDGFLNHRIEPAFIAEAGRLLADAFAPARATCVLTAEAAGNVIAYEVARRLNVAALYAKKGRAATMAQALKRRVPSPTKGGEVELSLSREYVGPRERVLIVDDFLYRGTTSAALADMAREAGAELVGFGFVIEKCFAGGRELLAPYGVPIVTLVPILRMDMNEIVFAPPRGLTSSA